MTGCAKITRYIVISGDDADATDTDTRDTFEVFHRRIDRMLKEDFRPQGGISVDTDLEGETHYYQAMVYEEN